jgi:uncharacterized membrane protein YfcA
LAAVAAAGAAIGVVVLLVTPERVFRGVAPYLILAAVVLLLAQSRILTALRSRGHEGGRRWVLAATFACSIYGAYFGGALGVLLLALLSIASRADFVLTNAVKALLSLVINVVAALAYAAFAPVVWQAALALAVTSTAGGYLGGTVARHIPVIWLRLVTAALGLVAFVTLVR